MKWFTDSYTFDKDKKNWPSLDLWTWSEVLGIKNRFFYFYDWCNDLWLCKIVIIFAKKYHISIYKDFTLDLLEISSWNPDQLDVSDELVAERRSSFTFELKLH